MNWFRPPLSRRNRTSEYGIAAHSRYKEDESLKGGENEVVKELTWFRQVLEWQQDTAEPEEFLEFLRMDLFRGEIFVKTSRARGRIRHWIRKEEFDSAFKIGKDLLDRELKKAKRVLPDDPHRLLEAALSMGYADFEHVQAGLGRGDVGPTSVIKNFFPDHDPAEVAARQPTALERLAARLKISGRGVRIQGMDNLTVRYSRCCQPVPGDPVIGYVTRGRGVGMSADPSRSAPTAIERAAALGGIRSRAGAFGPPTDRRGGRARRRSTGRRVRTARRGTAPQCGR